jgi:hypothetical protein
MAEVIDRPRGRLEIDKPFCELSTGEHELLVRVCERWYAERESDFAAFKGQYIAISYYQHGDTRPYVISPSSLDVSRRFEFLHGKNGHYGRRLGDPIFVF